MLNRIVHSVVLTLAILGSAVVLAWQNSPKPAIQAHGEIATPVAAPALVAGGQLAAPLPHPPLDVSSPVLNEALFREFRERIAPEPKPKHKAARPRHHKQQSEDLVEKVPE
jgi:hypothetical protein